VHKVKKKAGETPALELMYNILIISAKA